MTKRHDGLDALRAIAMLGIVAWHTPALGTALGYAGLSQWAWSVWWVCVPFFFVASGYLFVYRLKQTGAEPLIRWAEHSIRLLGFFFVWLCLMATVRGQWGLLFAHPLGAVLNGDDPVWQLWFIPALVIGLLVVTLACWTDNGCVTCLRLHSAWILLLLVVVALTNVISHLYSVAVVATLAGAALAEARPHLLEKIPVLGGRWLAGIGRHTLGIYLSHGLLIVWLMPRDILQYSLRGQAMFTLLIYALAWWLTWGWRQSQILWTRWVMVEVTQ